MPTTAKVWLHVQEGLGGGVGAQFASRVLLRPFGRLKELQWGWNAGNLLDEGLDRFLQFIETQHVREEYPGISVESAVRTLVLRYIHTPETPEIHIVLICRAQAATESMARSKALEYWEEIHSGVPYDYFLQPALSQSEFALLTGQDVLKNMRDVGDVVEIQRYINELHAKSHIIPFPGQWHVTPLSNEQIWRALCGCSRSVIYQIALEPVALREDERCWMQAQGDAADQTSNDEKENRLVRKYAEYAARVYAEQSHSYRNLYHQQVLLMVAGGVPEYLCRAVGTAFTHHEDRLTPLPGYHVVDVLPSAQEAILNLDLPWNTPGCDNVINRLVYMMNAQEAHVAFRLPYPSAGGIPGAFFEYKEE